MDIARKGDGFVLSPDDRLEALAWSLRECGGHGDLNDLIHSAPFRSLTKFPGSASDRASRLVARRYAEITAAYAASDAARRHPVAESKE